jgi:hypothetical protein
MVRYVWRFLKGRGLGQRCRVQRISDRQCWVFISQISTVRRVRSQKSVQESFFESFAVSR